MFYGTPIPNSILRKSFHEHVYLENAHFIERLSVVEMHERSLKQESVLVVDWWQDGRRQVINFSRVKLVINKAVS